MDRRQFLKNTSLDDDTLLASDQVRQICGGITATTLWRWLKPESNLGFPRPIKIARNNYWKLGELRAWRESRPRKEGGYRALAANSVRYFLFFLTALFLAFPVQAACTSITTGSLTQYSCDDGRTGSEQRVGPYTSYSGTLYGGRGLRAPLKAPTRAPLVKRFGEPKKQRFGVVKQQRFGRKQ